jgi:hypothetical protein
MATKKKETTADSVRKNYPQFAYLLDNPDLFGQDVADVLTKAVKGKWTIDRFKGAVTNTIYWQNTVASAKKFDAAPLADQQEAVALASSEVNSIADVSSIDPAEVDKFVKDMARRNVSGEALRKQTYQFVFTKGKAMQAEADALASKDAADIRKAAKAFGSPIDDATIEGLLSSGKKPADVLRMYQVKTKGLYPHLADQIEAGLTLDDITADYRRVASNVLEKSENEFDFTKPEYLESIAKRDDKGNLRQLSLGEWARQLRTDDRYGYSKTNAAIAEARQLSMNIVKAFGKVL